MRQMSAGTLIVAGTEGEHVLVHDLRPLGVQPAIWVVDVGVRAEDRSVSMDDPWVDAEDYLDSSSQL